MMVLMAAAALALPVIAAASPKGAPSSLLVTLHLTERGWQIKVGDYQLFQLGITEGSNGSSWVQLNCNGYVQLIRNSLYARTYTTVLPIQILPDDKGGWDIAFLGQKWVAKRESHDGYSIQQSSLWQDDRVVGDITQDSADTFYFRVRSDALVERSYPGK